VQEKWKSLQAQGKATTKMGQTGFHASLPLTERLVGNRMVSLPMG